MRIQKFSDLFVKYPDHELEPHEELLSIFLAVMMTGFLIIMIMIEAGVTPQEFWSWL